MAPYRRGLELDRTEVAVTVDGIRRLSAAQPDGLVEILDNHTPSSAKLTRKAGSASLQVLKTILGAAGQRLAAMRRTAHQATTPSSHAPSPRPHLRDSRVGEIAPSGCFGPI